MKRRPAVGLLYVTPLLVCVLALSLYPVIDVIRMSFSEVILANIRESRFVGLANYRALLKVKDPSFLQVLRITLLFVGGSVILHILIGLGLAVMLNNPWLRVRGLLRNLYMMPWITAGIIVGYTWSFLLEPRAGIVNYLLSLAGLPTQSWTADPVLALPAIILANVWRGVPYSLILQTAGLQSINLEIYDAARVDGAGPAQTFLRITLPLIREFLLLNFILDTGLTLHVFDTIFAMTAGGPLHRTETFSIFMYYQAFKFGELGRGSAVGMVLLLLSVLIAVSYMRFFRPGRARHG
jgi:ABC-type sugar transport system permease subunit